jgi:NAD(P)H-flavin reductase
MSVPSGTLQVLTIRCDGNPAEAAAAIRVGGTGSCPVLTRGVVDRIAHAGESIRVVTVRLERPVDYRPGQYFEWILPGITPNRAYSAANPPGSKQLEFHVRLHPAGQVSDRLSTGALAQGDSIGLKGPFGHFGLSSEARPALLIAGGTGMAPVKAMLEAAFARGDRRSLRFFYGARRQDELYTADMLNLWMVKMPNFEFVPVLSDEPPGGSWTGGRGRVTDIVAERVHDVLGFEAYLCGPPGMIDAATALLLARGLDPADLHVDRFTAAA